MMAGAEPPAVPGEPPEPPPPSSETTFSEDPLEHSNLAATFMVIIMVTWLIFGHKIQGMFRWTRWVSEGSMACILGIVSGVFLLVWDVFHANYVHKSLSFDSAYFFTYMLPPIIFYGGLAIKRKLFISNLLSILLFGVAGTFISFSLLGVTLYSLALLPNVLTISDCFSLAAIFAATDSVAVLQVLRPEAQPALYSIVLGEGVLNDATAVALLRAVPAPDTDHGESATLSATVIFTLVATFLYVFFASVALGAAAGLAVAAVMKRVGPFSQPQEVALVGALAFLSYLLAEDLGLSGILTLFFCGMAVSHYALQHVSATSRAALLNAFATLSYLLEGIIFLYVGRDALDPVKWSNANFFQTLYLVVAIAALVAVSRACFVFPLAWLHNRYTSKTLSVKDTIVVWWAGMMRGAVSVAMVYYRFDPNNEADDKHAATIVVTTLQLVLYSTVGLGGLTGPFLCRLLPPQEVTPPDVTGRQLHGQQGDEAASGDEFGLRRADSDDSFGDDQYQMLLPVHQRAGYESPRGAVHQELHSYPASPDNSDSAAAGAGTSAHAQAAAVQGSSRPPVVRGSRPPPGRPLADVAAASGQESISAAAARFAPLPSASSVLPAEEQAASGAGNGKEPRMADKMLHAAQSIADLTGFEGNVAGSESGTAAEPAIARSMYQQLRALDSKYLQPMFGSNQREGQGEPRSAEHSNPATPKRSD